LCTRGTYPILPGKRLGSLFLYNTTVATPSFETDMGDFNGYSLDLLRGKADPF